MKLTSKTVSARITEDQNYFYISIGGTDEPEDIGITLNFKTTINGFHQGCSKVASDIANQFDTLYQPHRGIKPVRIKGHSLGASVGELIAEFLCRLGWEIKSVKCYGGFGVRKSEPVGFTPGRYRAGHDLVPLLFFWKYKNPINHHIPGDPDGKWPTRFISDHNAYPWRKY